MIPGLYFTFAAVALLLVVNALRPPSPPGRRLPPLYLPGLVASELPGVWLVVLPLVTGVAWVLGAFADPVGVAGLAPATFAGLGQLVVWRRSRRGAAAVGPPVELPHRALLRAVAYPGVVPPEVERTEHHFAHHPHRARPLRLDLYLGRAVSGPRPVILHLHGGGWRGGHPRQTGQTLIHHLARCGWAVASIEYPLSPAATFPDHLVGVDAAHRWIRSRPELGGPIVVMGGSAGAHLAATAGLTRDWVDGVVGLYGIYDFLNRNRARPDWPLIPDLVMKATPEDAPDLYRSASPLDLVHSSAPPFLLVHGTSDSVVGTAESTHFAAALEEERVSVDVLLVPWAQHGFDARAGRRTRAVAGHVERWLAETVLSARPAPAGSDISGA